MKAKFLVKPYFTLMVSQRKRENQKEKRDKQTDRLRTHKQTFHRVLVL